MISRKIKKILPKRHDDSNKATFGKVINIAGSQNYTGAAYLSSISALKVGAGYVTLASSDYVCKTVACLTPDITFLPLTNLDDLKVEFDKYGVISIGCGLTQSEDAKMLVEFVIDYAKDTQKPVVLDADGLNILAQSDVEDLGLNFILTPHPKELARLLGEDVENVLSDREKYINLVADKYNCNVILKGYNTLVTDEIGVWKNKTGNSTLAKAGTGDVLCGMVAGFIAQGCTIIDAAKLAVYIHGLSGEYFAKRNSEYSLLASDLLNYIPKILKKF